MPQLNSSVSDVAALLLENERRNAVIAAPFSPLTGEGSVGERFEWSAPPDLVLPHPSRHLWLPATMAHCPLLLELSRYGSVKTYLDAHQGCGATTESVADEFDRLRCAHDFPYWASRYVRVKNKEGGDDVPFILTRPQRRFVAAMEHCRLSRQPIRIVLLKARQWGGSTTSQIYMAWQQLVLHRGLNSLIIAHQSAASDEIMDMFHRMMESYHMHLLYEPGETPPPKARKMTGVGRSRSIMRVEARNCKVKVGTAERPDGCRGGDYSLVHLSEVGLWRATDGKKPEDIVRSACAGVLYKPGTAIVYESTANGTGNFFQREYAAAADPLSQSQFKALFVAWHHIERYSLPLVDLKAFAAELLADRHNDYTPSDRREPGRYLWWLWEQGATLEAINWYVHERAKYSDHGYMAAEYPSDDVEAFVHSGNRVFDDAHVRLFETGCRPPAMVGDVSSDIRGDHTGSGRPALQGLHFTADRKGCLEVWQLPEVSTDEKVLNRYLVVVDVGGRSLKADWSVIVVFDRLFMPDGGKPEVVAQWRGHTDIDLLAWKAAQIAAFYDDALLVIESNTLETHDRYRAVEGDQSGYILSQIREAYPNLYARRQSEEEVRQGMPTRYGFHTNVATKPMVISTLVRVVREQLYIERDRRCLDEYRTYERRPNGSYGAIVGHHDDLLMTRAIGLHICFHDMELPRVVARRQRGGGIARVGVIGMSSI